MLINWATIMPRYWLGWFVGMFVTFIIPEVVWLFKNPQYTLSWTLWHVEQFTPGQGITHWTAGHFLIGGIILVFLLWLIGHLVVGIWV